MGGLGFAGNSLNFIDESIEPFHTKPFMIMPREWPEVYFQGSAYVGKNTKEFTVRINNYYSN